MCSCPIDDGSGDGPWLQILPNYLAKACDDGGVGIDGSQRLWLFESRWASLVVDDVWEAYNRGRDEVRGSTTGEGGGSASCRPSLPGSASPC